MITNIVKRDGRIAGYSLDKIEEAIKKAIRATGGKNEKRAGSLAKKVEQNLIKNYDNKTPTVEQIQDEVEKVLIDNKLDKVAKAYILYRDNRNKVREMNSNLMKTFDKINNQDSKEFDLKRENANIDGETPMGVMLRFGSESSKTYFTNSLLRPEQAKAYQDGDIHIHDFDFYALTETCCQIDIEKLFKGGFSTGHGFIREPNDIRSYASLVCIAIQANQNDQHGGQSVPNFDYGLAEGVKKTFKKLYRSNFAKAYVLKNAGRLNENEVVDILKKIEEDFGLFASLNTSKAYDKQEEKAFEKYIKK